MFDCKGCPKMIQCICSERTISTFGNIVFDRLGVAALRRFFIFRDNTLTTTIDCSMAAVKILINTYFFKSIYTAVTLGIVILSPKMLVYDSSPDTSP